MRRIHRKDLNQSALIRTAEALNGLWIPGPPFDGWLFHRDVAGSRWSLIEIKDPKRINHKDQYTEAQQRLFIKLKEFHAPYHVIRTEDDMLALMGARRSA